MVKQEREMYDFTLDEIKLFKNVKGIYAIIHNDKVLYVGQSKNIADRLRSHRNENALKNTINKIIREVEKNGQTGNYNKTIAMYDYIDKHRSTIKFIVLKETEELDKWEEHYIKLFQPKYNYKGVDVPYK